MNAKSLMLFSFGMTVLCIPANAQFYTIEKENNVENKKNVVSNDGNQKQTVSKNDESEEDWFYNAQDSMMLAESSEKRKEEENELDFFSSTDGHEVSIERDVPVFVSARDSLLFGLIRDRMDVCLPLDYISVNSRYGYRKDPFSKCEKFHDGIDLQCNMQHVYSMLSGKVLKTVYGKKGYGNYVVMDYGHIQVLYGHLSMITVRQGDEVYAGTIIGVSGNSGKSSGPHLHIKISSNGKSLNPTPFIAYLNRYITRLQDRIAYVRFGTKPPKELNIANLYEALDRYGVMYPKIVVAQALLETGYFTSNICLNYNNLFGLRRPSDGSYYQFENWEQSVKAYKDYVQYKYHGGNYLRFLQQIGYAEDPSYIYKVRSISNSL